MASDSTSSDMAGVVTKFKNLKKISNKLDKFRKKISKTPKTLQEVQPRLHQILTLLSQCSNYDSKEACDALEYISELSEISDSILCKNIGLYLVEQKYCDMFVKIATYLQECRRRDKGGNQQWFYNLILLESAFANYAYRCPELGQELGQSTGVKVLLQELDELHSGLDDPTMEFASDIVTAILGILHSCIYVNAENREIYKRENAIEILTKYLKRKDMTMKTTSLLLLFYVDGELRSEIVAANLECIGHMTELLRQAVDSKDHNVGVGNSRFSARELLNCLNLLAINDSNKEEIHKHGGLSSINRMLQADFSEEEQKVGAEGLWNLAFIESVKCKPTMKDITKSLKSLKKSANKALSEASTYALWELENKFGNSSKSDNRPDESGIEPETQAAVKPKTSKSKVPHVMISYQWNSQKQALKIRDELVASGYKVWMDVDKMKGNILTAMADAVENAAVVVVCMTRKYKASLNCRSEASYAYKHSKQIVPVLMEENFQPDGWLGLFVGMQLYYKLYSDDLMDENMQALIRDIGKRGAVVDASDQNEDTTIPESRQAQNQPTKPNVQEWSAQRVQQWFTENGLTELCSTLDFCDGKHLQDMYNRYVESPESFRNDLKSDLKLSFTSSVKFTTALDNLSK